MKKVHLGFEIGTSNAVEIPIAHMAVVGQTQSAGKTTTLEALVGRSGATALTFITKRGESSFASGRRITPYFRDRADWQFVTSIIDATLQEKNKFLRPWIMKICRNTRSLAEVQTEIRKALKKSHGISEGVYTQLDAYLDLIVPEIERADLAETLDLAVGINVMDVSSFATPMQMLFVQSALDWINERCSDTIVVIPEAWEFVPEGKGSPVKASAVTLVRKGAGIHNFIWVDSQDMAGVDKTILRGCTVWLIGVQREANEIKRNLLNIPAGIQRPKPNEVAMLERGQFFACFGRHIIKVYVQPKWMTDIDARAIAEGAQPPSAIKLEPALPFFKVELPKEEEVTREEADKLRAENERLRNAVNGGIDEAMATGIERGKADAEAQLAPIWFRRGVEAAVEHFKGFFMTFDPGFIGAVVPATPTLQDTGRIVADMGMLRLPAAPATVNIIDTFSARKPRTGNSGEGAGEKMRAALERFAQLGDWQFVAIVAGMQAGNGYFYGGRKWLLDNGHAIEAGGVIRPAFYDATTLPPTLAEIVALWTSKLKEPSPRMLDALSDREPWKTESLSTKIGCKPGNGYWYGGIARLRDTGLIEQNGDSFRLSEFLRSLK
jgi:hypothetical protein